jgi:cytochrome c peroxidase
VDVTDAPFNRRRGEKPSLSKQEIKDVVAFLNALTDGYQQASRPIGPDAVKR